MLLLFAGLAFLTGVFFAGSIGPLPSEATWLVGALLLIALLERMRGPVALLAVLLAAFLGGVWRYQGAMPHLAPDSLAFYNDSDAVVVRGRVSGSPEEAAGGWRLRLDASEVQGAGGAKSVSGSALVYLPGRPSYSVDDLLEVRGELQTPPMLGEFDYREYLARRGIVSLMRYAEAELLEPASGFRPRMLLLELRNRLAGALERTLPEPQAGLAKGMLLGLRSSLPGGLREAFRTTGTTHVIVISGHNLSLVAGMMAGVGVWVLGRRRAFYPILAAVWLYALLVGLAAPVARAAIMASLVLLATHVGRRSTAGLSLVVAAAVMVGVAPLQLWDVSFQLSFLAMAGLVFLAPPVAAAGRDALESLLAGDRGRTVLPWAVVVSDLLAASAGATLATLPIIAANFGFVSLVGLPATLVLLPALPFVLVTSAVTAVAGLAWPPLGQVAGVVAWVFLRYMTAMVELWSRLPFAAVELRDIPTAWIVAYYSLVAGFALATLLGWPPRHLLAALGSMRRRLQPAGWWNSPWLLGGLALAAVLLWALVLVPSREGRMSLTFLDVGQGDAVLIEGPGGQRVLVDGGRDGRRLVELLDARLPVGDRRLDLVVATHPDGDHVGGLPAVIRRYQVGRVLEPDLEADTVAYREWQEALAARGVARLWAQRGQRIRLGRSVRLEVLNPGAAAVGDANNDSVVLKVLAGGVCFLLTADVGQEGQRRLLEGETNLGCQVLKLPHHGAAQLDAAFVAGVRPAVAVVSVGGDNPYGHPSAEALSLLRGALVLRTDEQGSLRLSTDGRRLWLTTRRE